MRTILKLAGLMGGKKPATERLANGSMEAGDPPTGWISIASGTLASVADERTGGAGAKSLSITNGGATAGGGYRAMTNTAGVIKITGWVKRIGARGAKVQVFSASFGTTYLDGSEITSDAWAQFSYTVTVTEANCLIVLRNASATLGNEVRFDDVSVMQ